MSTRTTLAQSDILPLTEREFHRFRTLAYEQFGLDLGNGKERLVAARLGKQVRDLHLASFQDYYDLILQDENGDALAGMIDALTTNHTSFFREPLHFDFLREAVIPKLRHRERIAIWSAACSTGEEPYSIAFCLRDELGLQAMSKVHILATDISTRALAKAQKAVYPAGRLVHVPATQLRNYLRRGEREWEDWYLVKKEIRAAVTFRRLNLMKALSGVPSFPVVFCRNVMIYFDKPTQQNLIDRLTAHLEPGGYLLIGHSESLHGIDHKLRYIRSAVYQKVP
jgi:chemotaxis protein methyltransferase CheR